MANDARQERQLMRQRGAGSRQINDIDFGFAFNTPSQIRRSRTRSRTPQTVIQNTRQTLKTPIETRKRSVHNPPSSTHSSRSIRFATGDDRDRNTSDRSQPPLKRRRLSEISNLTNGTNVGPILSIGNEIIDEAEEATIQETEQACSDEAAENAVHSLENGLGENKENNVNALSSKGVEHKRRKRKSIGQQRTKRKRTSIEPAAQNLEPQGLPHRIQENANGSEIDEQTNATGLGSKSLIINATKGQEDVALHKPNFLFTVQSRESPASSEAIFLPKGKRKRKSILFTKKKRRSTGSTAQTPVSVNADITRYHENEILASEQEARKDDQSDSGLGDEQEQSDRETYHDTETLIHDQAQQPNRKQDQAQSDDSEASDQEYHPDEASPEPTPSHNRKSKPVEAKQKLKTRLKKADVPTKKNNRSTSTFPVLTHRITNLHQLPTISEESEAEETNEPEHSAHPPSFTTRDAPNAVDVLAHICRETIDSSIASLQKHSQTNNISKASLKQKASALQNFRVELENRLFDVSQSLDHRLQLEARLRKSRREKASVQAQWLEVRKRRDQIALRIDAVRRRHWENEIVGRKAWEVSEAAMKVEANVHMSADEMVDNGGQLEIMLRNLARDVSSLNGGGVLQRLRGFNAQLERFAGSFEG